MSCPLNCCNETSSPAWLGNEKLGACIEVFSVLVSGSAVVHAANNNANASTILKLAFKVLFNDRLNVARRTGSFGIDDFSFTID